jgi:hypothetical protein
MLDSVFSVQIANEGVVYPERKTIEFLGGGVAVADDPVNERTKITIANAEGTTRAVAHADTHANGGSDALDGDRLRVDHVPTGYTRTLAPESTAVEDLASHLNGISLAAAAAKSSADTAQTAANTAQAAANAAAVASGAAAINYNFMHVALSAASATTRRMWPGYYVGNWTATDEWRPRILIPDTGRLVSLTVQHMVHTGGPSTLTYTVWLSTDNGLTFNATALTVARLSNSNVFAHVTGSIAVARGNMIGVEVAYAGAAVNSDRLVASVLYQRTV